MEDRASGSARDFTAHPPCSTRDVTAHPPCSTRDYTAQPPRSTRDCTAHPPSSTRDYTAQPPRSTRDIAAQHSSAGSARRGSSAGSARRGSAQLGAARRGTITAAEQNTMRGAGAVATPLCSVPSHCSEACAAQHARSHRASAAQHSRSARDFTAHPPSSTRDFTAISPRSHRASAAQHSRSTRGFTAQSPRSRRDFTARPASRCSFHRFTVSSFHRFIVSPFHRFIVSSFHRFTVSLPAPTSLHSIPKLLKNIKTPRPLRRSSPAARGLPSPFPRWDAFHRAATAHPPRSTRACADAAQCERDAANALSHGARRTWTRSTLGRCAQPAR